MRFGDTSLHIVSDGCYWADGGGLFGLVPKALWAQFAEPDERNRLRFDMRSLLIETREQRILVGTGYGDKLSDKERAFVSLPGERRLLGSLEELGIGPLDVGLVINTHLHGDHCGGNTRRDGDGELVPAFPWATCCVQRQELADAMFPNERTRVAYNPADFVPLQEARQLRVLWGDTRLTDEVRVVVTPGHTRAHQSVVVESGGQTAIFMGSVAPWPIHLEHLSWVPAYDVEPLISIETKRKLAHWAIENHVLLIFEHHPELVAGYLHAAERSDRFRLEPVDLES
jgi:glyoxylase-like metal-dependent hydrolase (beta-lactamase superfamily II)